MEDVTLLLKRIGDGDARARDELFGLLYQDLRRLARDYRELDAAQDLDGPIFEAEHLQIGMTAPDIAGTDVNGREVRLSQFRGCVVLVNFWGFW